MVRELENGLAFVQQELARRLLAKLRESTPKRTGYTASRWAVSVVDGQLEVSNDAGETVMRLNDGWSRQEPAGFIERCIDEVVAEMRIVVTRPIRIRDGVSVFEYVPPGAV